MFNFSLSLSSSYWWFSLFLNAACPIQSFSRLGSAVRCPTCDLFNMVPILVSIVCEAILDCSSKQPVITLPRRNFQDFEIQLNPRHPFLVSVNSERLPRRKAPFNQAQRSHLSRMGLARQATSDRCKEFLKYEFGLKRKSSCAGNFFVRGS